MRVDGPSKGSLSFDNMQNRPVKGTIDIALMLVEIEEAPV